MALHFGSSSQRLKVIPLEPSESSISVFSHPRLVMAGSPQRIPVAPFSNFAVLAAGKSILTKRVSSLSSQKRIRPTGIAARMRIASHHFLPRGEDFLDLARDSHLSLAPP